MDSQKPGFEGRMMNRRARGGIPRVKKQTGGSCLGISKYPHKIKSQSLGMQLRKGYDFSVQPWRE